MENSRELIISKVKQVTFVFLLVMVIGCGKADKAVENSLSAPLITQEYIIEGKALSEVYCGACHLYVTPDQLPKHIWRDEVLPRMGSFYGIYEKESRTVLLESGEAKSVLLEENIFPEAPILDSLSWEKIKAYFLATAPDRLEIPEREELIIQAAFTPASPKLRISPPMSTMVQFGVDDRLIYHGDVKKDYSLINIFDQNLEVIQSLAMRSPAVEVMEKDGELWALLMGSFTSTDAPSGSIVRASKVASNEYNKLETVIDSLQRAVDMAFVDLDNDGDEDIVVAQFGNWAGRLEWFENTGHDQYQRHLMMAKSGPTKIHVEDVNNDGLEDLLVMVTQSDESVYALINQGDGQFNEIKLLQLPPTHGSLTFEYLDMDADGIKDIVHVAGDNADYEAILKPFHGIRIFKGAPDFTFKEAYFYPVHGAYKAISKDFDGDGDNDIAVISFFPDYDNGAKETLMMLENVTNTELQFKGFTLPGYDLGRWDVMDSGDIDQDGDPDLIVGSFVVSDPYGNQSGVEQPAMMKGPMMMVLRNKWGQ